MPAGRPAGRPEISLRKSLRKSLSPAQPTPCFEKGPRSLLENGRFLRPHEAYSFAEIISFIRNLYKWNNFPHLYKWKKNNFPELIRSENTFNFAPMSILRHFRYYIYDETLRTEVHFYHFERISASHRCSFWVILSQHWIRMNSQDSVLRIILVQF